jgi:hypothetical protein
MRAVTLLLAALSAAALVYGIPVWAEEELIRLHLNPWLVCVVLSDLPGCLLLYSLGLRSVAIGVYILSGALEAAALTASQPLDRLVFATNILPAIILAVVLCRMSLRSALVDEETS